MLKREVTILPSCVGERPWSPLRDVRWQKKPPRAGSSFKMFLRPFQLFPFQASASGRSSRACATCPLRRPRSSTPPSPSGALSCRSWSTASCRAGPPRSGRPCSSPPPLGAKCPEAPRGPLAEAWRRQRRLCGPRPPGRSRPGPARRRRLCPPRSCPRSSSSPSTPPRRSASWARRSRRSRRPSTPGAAVSWALQPCPVRRPSSPQVPGGSLPPRTLTPALAQFALHQQAKRRPLTGVTCQIPPC
jgi:hypothetical protein